MAIGSSRLDRRRSPTMLSHYVAVALRSFRSPVTASLNVLALVSPANVQSAD